MTGMEILFYLALPVTITLAGWIAVQVNEASLLKTTDLQERMSREFLRAASNSARGTNSAEILAAKEERSARNNR